jgi:putative endonuclease
MVNLSSGKRQTRLVYSFDYAAGTLDAGVIMATNSTGDRGEEIACRFLKAKGYRIVATNWRCRGGEIDVVAKDGETLVFVEVKTRRGLQAGEALASISPVKRQRMIVAAYSYAAQSDEVDPLWRIDAVAITISPNGTARCTHVENALDW